MFADPPPPPPPEPPPAITAQQQADLQCVRLGLFISSLAPASARDPRGPRMVQGYLRRLQRSDDTRDWRTLATPLPEMSYGEYMVLTLRCQVPGRRY